MSSFSRSKVPPLPSKIEKDLDEEFVELLTFI